MLDQTSPSSLLVVRGLAGRQSLEVRDQRFPFGHAVHANLTTNARRQDLLGSSEAYAKEFLDLGAVNPSVGQLAQARRTVEAYIDKNGHAPDWMGAFAEADGYSNTGFLKWLDEDNGMPLTGATKLPADLEPNPQSVARRWVVRPSGQE